ncbi:MAG TPA: thiamine phosphate synthase [bacterium]|nr:thiamine phosphate synthase [bacterium]
MRSKPAVRGLYAIVDSTVTPETDLSVLTEEYLRGGASVIQLRDKRRLESPDRERIFRDTAGRIQDLKARFDFIWIVNDDLGVAKAIGADGVHVGRDDPSPEECRRILGPDKIIGYSSHGLEEAVGAERRGADYIAFGAIFSTPTKGPGHPVQGLEKLRQVVKAVKIPVVAIGGINRSNIKDVLATGVHSVAMISALAKTGDRIEEARYFSALFK